VLVDGFAEGGTVAAEFVDRVERALWPAEQLRRLLSGDSQRGRKPGQQLPDFFKQTIDAGV